MENLNEPGLSVSMENFFKVVVAPACEILPIALADAGNLF